MKQKTQVVTAEFTTIEQSPVGKIIKRLEKKLAAILALDKKNTAKPSLERAYSIKQLSLLKNNIDDINTLLSYFSEGEGPGLTSMGFHTAVFKIKNAINESTEFFSPEFVAFQIIAKQLKDLIPQILNTIKLVTVTMKGEICYTLAKDNEFASLLKQKLRQGPRNRFAAAEKIPGWNQSQFFINLDLAIDKFFDNQDVMAVNEKALIDILNQTLIDSISNTLFGYFSGYSFIPGYYNELQFVIVDQLVYDFAVEILELWSMVPEQLEDLITFFNPPVITKGIIPGIISTIFNISITNKSIELDNIQEKKRSYVYEIAAKEINWSKTIDLSTLYFNYKDEVINFLSTAIGDYLINYAHTPHVQSELSKGQPASDLVREYIKPKAELMKEFIEREKSLEVNCLSIIKESMNISSSSEESNDDEAVDLNSVLECLKNAQIEFRNLEQRKSSYQTTPIKILMNKRGDLRDLKGARLNPEQPLPTVIVTRNKEKNFKTVILTEELKISKNLVEQHSKLDAKINEVKMLIKRDQDELYNQEIAYHEKENQKIIQDLTDLFDRASFKPSQISGNLTEQIKTIETELARLENKIDLLPNTIDKVKSIQEFLNKPIECPDNLEQFNLQFIENASNCYNSGKNKAKEIIGQLNGLADSYQIQKQELLSALNKVNAEIRLAETMKCSDPTPVFALIAQQEQNKIQLQLKAQSISTSKVNKENEFNNSAINKKLSQNSSEACTKKIEANYELVKGCLNSLMLDVLEQFSANELFIPEQLNKIEYIEKTLVWLGFELEKCKNEYNDFQKSSTKDLQGTIDDNLSLLNAITIAKDLIGKGQLINKFPFANLNETLEDFYDIPWIKRAYTDGFELLLDQLNDSYHKFSKWKAYKDLPYNKIEEEIKSLISFLGNKFNLTQAEIDRLTKLSVYEREVMNLGRLGLTLKNLSEAHKELANYDLLITQKSELLAEIQKLKEELESTNNEINILDKDQNILRSIAELLGQNQNLTQLIAEIESEKSADIPLLIQKQKTINPMLISARNQLAEINDKVKKVNDEISKLENKKTHSESINTINSLLEENKTKICKAEKDIFTAKQEDLRNSINENKNQLSAVQCGFKEVLTLDQFNQLLTNYLKLKNGLLLTSEKEASLQRDLDIFVELHDVKDGKIQLSNELQLLCEEKFNIKPLILNKSFELIEINGPKPEINQLAVFPVAQLKQLKTSLEKLLPDSQMSIDSINGRLKGFMVYSTDLVNKFNDEFNQNRDKLNVNGKKATQETINTISIYLNNLPINELNLLNNSLELLDPEIKACSDLKLLLSNLKTLKDDTEKATTVNSNLAKQAELRKGAIERVKTELDNYELNRQSRYPVKDLFFKDDRDIRSDFISGLKPVLDIYANSGESSAVVNYLKNKKFPGFNLQPIINRLNLVIKAHELAENNQVDSSKINIRSEQNSKAATILSALSNDFSWKDYSNRIKILNNKIDAIPVSLEDGPDRTIAKDLRDLLSEEIDIFVIKQHELILKRASEAEMKKFLDDFQVNFECLLHSQDDILCKYTSIATQIANIGLALLAVLTFGSSALFSLWYSGAVFFKPDAIECINDAEQTANEISVPAA